MEANEIGSPILNTTSVKTLYAVFQKDCGDDDLCQSELVLNANTDFRCMHSYILLYMYI